MKQNRDVKSLIVSNHAILRYKERRGIAFDDEKIIAIVKKSILNGNEIRPVFAALKLINNNFIPANYYQSNGLVFVVVDNMLITCYRYDKKNWIQFKK